MCTLSWTPAAGGYWVFFNRDERRTRAPGLLPEPLLVDGVRALAPADGDFGGTWIGVNQLGVVAALLNRYEDTPHDPGPARISRGLLLRSLLSAGSSAAILARLDAADLTRYQPFTVAAFDPGGQVRLADWTGTGLAVEVGATAGLVRTSSGRDQRTAERIRTEVFAAALGAEPPTPARLRALHRSHRPERGPFSVCMHREEAETRSETEIRVGPRVAVLRYRAGPPCVTRAATVHRLSRRDRAA